MTNGTGKMSVGGNASVDKAPARKAISARRHPQASTMVWAKRVSVTGGVRISMALRRGTA